MTPPPIYTHAVKLYDAFLNLSVEATEQDAETLEVQTGTRLFIGNWSTQFAHNLDLPRESTQQKAYKFLQQVGCLEVLRKGGRDHAGIILLNRAPTPADADQADADTRAARLGKLGTVEVAVRGLTNRVSALEEQVNVLTGQYDALLRDVELQLSKMTNRINDLVVVD